MTLLDLLHKKKLKDKFASFRFKVNRDRAIMCPICGRGMLRLEVLDYRARHYRCSESGLFFYGDDEGLYICFNSLEDCVKGENNERV